MILGVVGKRPLSVVGGPTTVVAMIFKAVFGQRPCSSEQALMWYDLHIPYSPYEKRDVFQAVQINEGVWVSDLRID